MLEHTKKLHTNNVILSFAVPSERQTELIQLITKLGYNVNIEPEIYSFKDTFKANSDSMLASCLRGLRYRENMTQELLAKKSGISRRHISAFENGRRKIDQISAGRLAEVFKVDKNYFRTSYI